MFTLTESARQPAHKDAQKVDMSAFDNQTFHSDCVGSAMGTSNVIVAIQLQVFRQRTVWWTAKAKLNMMRLERSHFHGIRAVAVRQPSLEIGQGFKSDRDAIGLQKR
ncbi:MAG: hypothetical protein CMP47_13985 [Rickettsiales bacterium]|nr:hypothetical protein [Rickettsiales bacterium]